MIDDPSGGDVDVDVLYRNCNGLLLFVPRCVLCSTDLYNLEFSRCITRIIRSVLYHSIPQPSPPAMSEDEHLGGLQRSRPEEDALQIGPRKKPCVIHPFIDPHCQVTWIVRQLSF
jgi:hypothetical protein